MKTYKNSARASRRWQQGLGLPLLLASLLLPSAGSAQDNEVGHAVMVYQGANRTPPGGTSRDLWPDYPVYFQDNLRTLDNYGALHVVFVDGTEMRMGEGASLMVDRFVFNPDAGAGELAINVGKGFARFVSGKLSGPTFKIRTPTAAIGIRGTDFSVWVESERNFKTTIWVNEGEIEVSPTAGGAAALVKEGEVVAVAPGSRQVMRDVPQPIADRGLGIGIRLSPPRNHHN